MRRNKNDYIEAKDRVKLSAGDVVRISCEMMEMSQADLARRSGIAASHISAIIKGTRPVGKAVAEKLAKPLHVSPGHILFAGKEPGKQSHVVELIDNKAKELRSHKRARKLMIGDSLRVVNKKHITPTDRLFLQRLLGKLQKENENEDITGFHVIAKKALGADKDDHRQ